MYFISRNSSTPCLEPSRPSPDSFTPPKGATSVEIIPSFTPTMPNSSISVTRRHARHIARIEIGGKPIRSSVRKADGFVLVVEAEKRRDGAERLLGRKPHAGIRIDENRRLEEGAAERMALPADDGLRTFRERIRDMRLNLREARLR